MKVDDMSQENIIDFTKSPGDFFYKGFDENDDFVYGPNKALTYLFIDNGFGFGGVIMSIVVIAYMKINATHADHKLHIPASASLDTLKCNDGENFFVELFNRFRIICEANEVLGDTASILEPFFMDGANTASSGCEAGIESELLELDWSESGFGRRDASLYVRDELIWSQFVFENHRANYIKELHHFESLLNIRPEEKQICTPVLYINYLANLFEQLGWGTNDYEKLVYTHLNNVTAVQIDPVLWAIQTLQVVLFGCDKPSILKADELSSIYNKAQNKVEDHFDVIFIPEVGNYSSIPDVGSITIGNISIDKNSGVYYVAFLYNLLNDKGRMLIRFNRTPKYSDSALDSDGKLLAFFVDNNLIDAMIQTENSVYMLVDKKRPETKHGKVLFYYQQYFEYNQECYPHKNENLASSIEEYSSEYIKLRHSEGVCIVSNQEIRLNDYCLLPKKYIYDFDRITANAEFQVVRHIAHDLSPKLSSVDSVLKHLTSFIASHELLQEPLQEQFYEGQTLEPVGEAIDKARSDISQMHKLIKDTRKVITEEIPLEEFSSVNMRDFLEATKKKYANGTFTLDIDCDQDIQYEMHETSFAEMIDNFVRNAEIHGFVNGDKRAECKIALVVTKRKNDPSMVVEIKNNGNPLPDELTVEKFTDFGSKGKNSPGDGLGGALIYKVIRAHRGNLEIIRNDKEYPVNFKITLPNPEVNK